MATAMESLPIHVQEELVHKRAQIPGWAMNAHATPDQWMLFYNALSEEARTFVVGSLLELAQQGSFCLQAEHDGFPREVERLWEQLREVSKLHNARVDEVTMLRKRLDELEGRGPAPDSGEPTLTVVE